MSHLVVRTARLTSILLVLAMSVTFGPGRVRAELPTIESLSEDPDKAVPGQEPKPKEVENAFNECLKQVDDDAKEMMQLNSFRKSVVDEQSALCKKGKNSCIVNPRGAECRAFIEDYAVEALAG